MATRKHWPQETTSAESNGILLWYYLSGTDLNPDEITELTGIAPTTTWRQGDLTHPAGKLRHTDNGWGVKSLQPESAPLGEHVVSIVDVLKPSWNELVQLGPRFEAQFSCSVFIVGAQGPELIMSREQVNAICDLSASIDFDTFAFDSWRN